MITEPFWRYDWGAGDSAEAEAEGVGVPSGLALHGTPVCCELRVEATWERYSEGGRGGIRWHGGSFA